MAISSTDPFDALRRQVTPRRVRPQFAAALRQRLEEELGMTSTQTDAAHGLKPDMVHIHVDDADRAMAFFGAVLDWQGERVEFEGHVRHYMTNTVDTQPVLTDEAADRRVRLGFKVDDLDAASATVERLGGSIDERSDYWALGRDNQGVPIVVWVPGDRYPHEPPTSPATGRIEWFFLRVPDPDAATAFYRDLRGWPIDARANDEPIAIPCATVPDIEAARARVLANGGSVDELEPMGPGVGCDCVDDQGTRFSLWQEV